MNQHKTSAELKMYAKGTLLGKYGTAIGALILIQLITQSVTLLASAILDTSSIYGITVNYAISLIMTLIAAIFSVGQISLYLNMASHQPYKVSNIFNGFRTHPDKAIIIQFLLFLISLGCVLPAVILLIIYALTKISLLMIFLSLLGVAGLIAAYIFMLQFSQSFYLMLDFPDYSAVELMKLSRRIMKGNCQRLFYIYVSFLPLYLLGLLSLGIGFLFIVPYQQMTNVYFYLDLIRCRENSSIEHNVPAADSATNYPVQ